MDDFAGAFSAAFRLIVTLDPGLAEIVVLSLRVSLTAVGLAALVGLPLGAALALLRFPGRRALTVAMNALMGMPPVVVGLIVYLLLSRAGPFGVLGLLFTPTAMIVACRSSLRWPARWPRTSGPSTRSSCARSAARRPERSRRCSGTAVFVS
jgi:tungstate transport system permease protein